MPKLFDDDDEATEEKLSINKSYAANYDNWRQKEVLHKLEAKYGEVENSDESSSDEDEDGKEMTEEFDKTFFETLACLKKKDPKIYDDSVTFFPSKPEEDEDDDSKIKKKKKKTENGDKKVTLRDYERKIITEMNGELEDEEEDFQRKKKEARNPTYVEEQKQLKESLKKALNDDEEDDSFFKVKSKIQEEIEEDKAEEDSYRKWLKGKSEEIDEEEKSKLKPLKDFWTDPKLDANEKFLRDYILNKKFLGDDDQVEEDYKLVEADNLSEDEKTLEKQEEFEHKYNFRFEEPDTEFIKRYPRTMSESLRKKDTKRSEKRAELKKRKEEDLLRKKEELKQMKALKRKEIMDKLAQLKEITGNDDMNFENIDLNSDFDPEEHDKKMNQLFDDNYYNVNTDDQKPEFPELDEELEVEKEWDCEADDGNLEVQDDNLHCEDPDFVMDADYNPDAKEEELSSTSKRKRKRKSKFAELISKKKPKFDPSVHSSLKDYIEQYYALDYEDMIGDLPCRFKYRKVVPNDYGLSTEEILLADDKELNKWCSLKKALKYKSEKDELWEVQQYKQKAKNENYRKKILRSLYETEEKEEEEKDCKVESDKKVDVNQPSTSNEGKTESKKGKNKKKKNKNKNKKGGEKNCDPVAAISDERLKAYGLNPKKFKNKLKYGKKK